MNGSDPPTSPPGSNPRRLGDEPPARPSQSSSDAAGSLQSRVSISVSPAADGVDPAGLLSFFRVVGRLKRTPRQGWVDRGVRHPESVADHTYRNTMMAWLLGAAAGLDSARLVKMMLVHDLPEAVVGDGTPYAAALGDGVDPAEVAQRWRDLLTPEQIADGKAARHRAEADAMDHIAVHVGTFATELGAELRELWIEYAERRSPEAQFASQIDKLEALLQAIEYRQQGEAADVENFLTSAREVVVHPVLRAVLSELEQILSKFAEKSGDPHP